MRTAPRTNGILVQRCALEHTHIQCDKPKGRKNAKVGHAKGRRNYKFLLADCVSVKSPLPPHLKVQTNSQLNPVRVLGGSLPQQKKNLPGPFPKIKQL